MNFHSELCDLLIPSPQCLILGRPSCISTYYIDCKLPTPEEVTLDESGKPNLDCWLIYRFQGRVYLRV